MVRETAVSTLTNIIRSTALNQIAQSRQISASESEVVADATVVDEEGGAGDVSAVSFFFDRAHDEFMLKLHEDFVKRYGVVSFNLAVAILLLTRLLMVSLLFIGYRQYSSRIIQNYGYRTCK